MVLSHCTNTCLDYYNDYIGTMELGLLIIEACLPQWFRYIPLVGVILMYAYLFFTYILGFIHVSHDVSSNKY